MTPNNHLRGKGCTHCADMRASIKQRKTTEQFILDAIKVHGDKYDYHNGHYINAYTKVSIICKKHGEFLMAPTKHLSGQSCPKCKSSHGENRISTILDQHNIKYIKEHSFMDCIHIKPLKFDFYIPSHNICIEFDGEQHFSPVSIFGGKEAYDQRVINDTIKSKYCISNNIILIRIPYTQKNNIHSIMQSTGLIS